MDDISYEDVLEVLRDVEEDIDYEAETALVDDKHLDSFDIIAIINGLSDEFDIVIPAGEIVPANFNSAQAIFAMVKRLAEDD